MPTTLHYSTKLDIDDRLNAEESIAAIIRQYPYSDEFLATEDECAWLSRDILMGILATFRPDLVVETLDPLEIHHEVSPYTQETDPNDW